MTTITSFLMFDGNAEEAMNFYVAAFPESNIQQITRYGDEGPGRPGSVMHAAFTIAGHPLICIDSAVTHAFTFTPAMSLYVSCDSSDEVDRLYAHLSDGGQTMMPLGTYPFNERFAWLSDRFGVSWQLAVVGKA